MVTPDFIGDITFPGKDREEEFIMYFRQHWIRLLPATAKMIGALIIIVAVALVSFIVFPISTGSQHVLAVVLILLFVATQMNFLMNFYRYFLRCTIFTDCKVHRIKKTLMFTDDHQSTDLWVIQDIDKRQRGLIQNMFGFGTLVLDAQETQLRLHFVPRIQEKYGLLLQLRERARERMTWGRETAPDTPISPT